MRFHCTYSHFFILIFRTLSSDVNDCNFPIFVLTLIVFILNTPESILDM